MAVYQFIFLNVSTRFQCPTKPFATVHNFHFFYKYFKFGSTIFRTFANIMTNIIFL